jgi:hypothetical protein
VKGFYVVGMPITEIENPSSGVGKKILDQLKALNTTGVEVKLLSLYKENSFISKIIEKVYPKSFYKRLPIDFFSVNFYYFRHYRISFAYLGIYTLIKKLNKKSKILVEIPTYPYDKEATKFYDKFNIILDRFLRKRIKKYIDKIVTYSNDNTIFYISTIKIVNGIDFSRISIGLKTKNDENTLNLAIVTQYFLFYHGYERIIEGLNYYYTKGLGNKKIFLHFIGEGPDLKKYKLLTSSYGLENFITFYGLLSGERLDDVLKKSDLAVCPLGSHRKSIFLGSFLKSREYMARGLPMVSSTKIDVLPDDYPFIKYVPEDESPIDIPSIVDFYEKLINVYSPEKLANTIRLFGERSCDILVTMKPVITYLFDGD